MKSLVVLLIFLFFLLGVVLGITLAPKTLDFKAAVAQCEEDLPRNQFCTAVITTKVVKDD